MRKLLLVYSFFCQFVIRPCLRIELSVHDFGIADTERTLTIDNKPDLDVAWILITHRQRESHMPLLVVGVRDGPRRVGAIRARIDLDLG